MKTILVAILSDPRNPVFVNDNDAFIPEIWAQEGLLLLENNLVAAQLVHRDGHERHRYLLAGGHEHVQLAPRRILIDLVGHLVEPVGCVTASGNSRDNAVAVELGLHNAACRRQAAIGVGHRRAPEFHHDRRHSNGPFLLIAS